MGQFSKNYRTFYQKSCQKALKNMVLGSRIRDPGSGKNLFWIPDPRSRGQKAPDPGSWIQDLYPQHWMLVDQIVRCSILNLRCSKFLLQIFRPCLNKLSQGKIVNNVISILFQYISPFKLNGRVCDELKI